MTGSFALGSQKKTIMPGFGLALGFTLTYLGLIVILPIAGLVVTALGIGPADFWHLATNERTLAALKLSFGAAFIAAAINLVFGFLVAWVLVRYDFPGRRFLDALVDLPFALPTAVAGITLTALYAPTGWLGGILNDFGIKVVFSRAGIILALTFIGLPFVVRTVQPVLQEVQKEFEEVAATLGASRFATVWRVILPTVFPALLTGFALAFARAVGEYGSVIFIAGNLPYQTEIAPLLIVIQLEEFNYAGATVISVVMLALSFGVLLLVNLIQAWTRRYFGNV